MSTQGIAPGFLALAVLLAAGTAYAVFRVFVSLRRDRFAADTPLARIRSAAQGYVHLEGEAGSPPEGPILAPLSGVPCVWWDYKVEHAGRSAMAATSGTSSTVPPAWRRSPCMTVTASV